MARRLVRAGRTGRRRPRLPVDLARLACQFGKACLPIWPACQRLVLARLACQFGLSRPNRGKACLPHGSTNRTSATGGACALESHATGGACALDSLPLQGHGGAAHQNRMRQRRRAHLIRLPAPATNRAKGLPAPTTNRAMPGCPDDESGKACPPRRRIGQGLPARGMHSASAECDRPEKGPQAKHIANPLPKPSVSHACHSVSQNFQRKGAERATDRGGGRKRERERERDRRMCCMG